jgi:hypothetical protein
MRSILEKNLICLLENLQFLVTLICGLPRKPEVNIHMVLIQVVYQFWCPTQNSSIERTLVLVCWLLAAQPHVHSEIVQ